MMSYTDLYDDLGRMLVMTLGNMEHLQSKVSSKEWDRSIAYINAIRTQMLSVRAMVMVLQEIDRTRPPTDGSGFLLPVDE